MYACIKKTKASTAYRGAAYEIINYTEQEPFASFLPGIAGERGIPLWCFYTNRGQAISSFGREGKDSPILEFSPADRAYRETGINGFRTFIRFADGRFYEPFGSETAGTERVMSIGKADLCLKEISHQLEVQVQYTTLPGDNFPALVRRVKFTNRGDTSIDMEVLDGLPRIVPHGVGDSFLKNMSNTAAAWIETGREHPEMPEFRVRASIEDSLAVSTIRECNFMLSRFCGVEGEEEIVPLVDSSALFGADTAFLKPEPFVRQGLAGVNQRKPTVLGKYPCAFSGFSGHLEPGESCFLNSLYGYSERPEEIYSRRAELTSEVFIKGKIKESCTLAEELVRSVTMKSGLPQLDAYTQFTGLDNILRGGYPRVWKGEKGNRIFHLYNRKHGDMERDYNAFSLPPRYYSSGFGNYRDVNQNRRTDVILNPETGEEAVRLFMSLIQSDGYNPLVVQPGKFYLDEESRIKAAERTGLSQSLLMDDFTPGGLLARVGGALTEEGLALIMELAEYIPEADFHEGYWVDHWTYNLDLIEQYLRVYPDREDTFYFGEPRYLWYRERRKIRPLRRRFRLVGKEVVQEEHLEEKDELSSSYLSIRSRLIEKLLTLAILKVATLDPSEAGLEMEAGRPGWYDALNGLPALFGSSLSDGAELLRLLIILEDLSDSYGERDLILFAPLKGLFEGLVESEKLNNSHERWLCRWNLRDSYREAIYKGEPKKVVLPLGSFREFLRSQAQKISVNISRAVEDRGGLLPTYYRYQPVGWKEAENGFVIPEMLKREEVPLFLEGIVKQIKLAGPEEAPGICRLVKKSPLFDKKLKMYRINESLSEMPSEIGRARAFPEGWLENGSIWLHMEYKYLLEILKAEQGREFWDEGKNCLIPFLDPSVYGRSPYENSSFLVSSVYPETSLHGKGFVSRLSGATAEYLTIWTYFLLGSEPFSWEDGILKFRPRPLLPSHIFDFENRLEWTLFGRVNVIYINEKGGDLFDKKERIPRRITVVSQGKEESYSSELTGSVVERLRKGDVQSLRVLF
jgi:hypothetical protein